MNLKSGAGLLHRLTSYAPERDWDIPVDDPRIRKGLVPNDLDTVPSPLEAYGTDLPSMQLLPSSIQRVLPLRHDIAYSDTDNVDLRRCLYSARSSAG